MARFGSRSDSLCARVAVLVVHQEVFWAAKTVRRAEKR